MNSIAGKRILQVVLFIAGVSFVWHTISQKEGLLNLSNVGLPPVVWLLLVLSGLLNWACEAVKWKILTEKYRQNFATAIRQTLQGAATAFFTPNRSGEFVGKVYKAAAEYRWQMISLSVAGSFFQLLTTLLFGLIGLFFVKPEWFNDLAGDTFIGAALVAAVFAFFGLLWKGLIPAPVFFQRNINKIKAALLEITRSQAASVFLLSVVRYLIFSSQLVLLLTTLGEENSLTGLYAAVMLFYLLSSFVPGSILGEIGVRESIAIFVFSPVVTPLVAVQASLLMWLVNILLPALAGSFLLLYKSDKIPYRI